MCVEKVLSQLQTEAEPIFPYILNTSAEAKVTYFCTVSLLIIVKKMALLLPGYLFIFLIASS